MPDPITPEQRLAEIRERDDGALKRAENPAFSLSQAEYDRTLLLDEVDRLNAEVKANRQRWYHNDQSRTECVAGFDPETRECAEGGGKVFSEVEYQAQLIEIWTDLTRSYERDVARLTSERDRLKARVEELSALLIDPDRPTERARELRAIHARDEMDREMDRLADGGDL